MSATLLSPNHIIIDGQRLCWCCGAKYSDLLIEDKSLGGWFPCCRSCVYEHLEWCEDLPGLLPFYSTWYRYLLEDARETVFS